MHCSAKQAKGKTAFHSVKSDKRQNDEQDKNLYSRLRFDHCSSTVSIGIAEIQ